MFARGDQYESYMGRWSRRIAPAFLAWLDVPPLARWLDVGCGTGALAEAILADADPSKVLAVDPSDAFIHHARTRINDPRASFEVCDAMHLPQDLDNIDAAVSGLVLNFVPDAGRALSEIARTLARGGIAGAYVWDYADGMEIMRRFWDAATALDAAASAFDEGRRDSICNARGLSDLFGTSLAEVEVTDIAVPAVFQSFEAYWNPFLGGQGSAGAYVTGLDSDRRQALRERLEHTLPVATDGSITLAARAWAVKGRDAG
jgi:SAM-dependent methyltransferase